MVQLSVKDSEFSTSLHLQNVLANAGSLGDKVSLIGDIIKGHPLILCSHIHGEAFGGSIYRVYREEYVARRENVP